MKLRLQDAILVGNYQNQIKFSELTIDMYRMLQSLERELMAFGGQGVQAPAAQAQKDEEMIDSSKPEKNILTSGGDSGDAEAHLMSRTNPRKYLLYRPTFAQLLTYLSTAFKDLGENSAMLLYLSADGSKRAAHAEQSIFGTLAHIEYSGGISTTVVSHSRKLEKVDHDQNSLIHTLHPADIVPISRKALFLIVDSTNSTAFNVFLSNLEFPQSF